MFVWGIFGGSQIGTVICLCGEFLEGRLIKNLQL